MKHYSISFDNTNIVYDTNKEYAIDVLLNIVLSHLMIADFTNFDQTKMFLHTNIIIVIVDGNNDSPPYYNIDQFHYDLDRHIIVNGVGSETMVLNNYHKILVEKIKNQLKNHPNNQHINQQKQQTNQQNKREVVKAVSDSTHVNQSVNKSINQSVNSSSLVQSDRGKENYHNNLLTEISQREYVEKKPKIEDINEKTIETSFYEKEIDKQRNELSIMKQELFKKKEQIESRKRQYEADHTTFLKVKSDIDSGAINKIPFLIIDKYNVLDFMNTNNIMNKDHYPLYRFLYNTINNISDDDIDVIDEDDILNKYGDLINDFLADECNYTKKVEKEIIDGNSHQFDSLFTSF